MRIINLYIESRPSESHPPNTKKQKPNTGKQNEALDSPAPGLIAAKDKYIDRYCHYHYCYYHNYDSLHKKPRLTNAN